MQQRLQHRFGIQFIGLSRRWRRAIDHSLASVGLTDATWSPLIHLHTMGDGVSQKALAAAVGIDSSSLVRLLDILQEKGLIARQQDDRDRRAKLLHLTPAGHEAVREIRTVLHAAEEVLLADLSDAQLEAMMAGFAAIERRIRLTQDGEPVV